MKYHSLADNFNQIARRQPFTGLRRVTGQSIVALHAVSRANQELALVDLQLHAVRRRLHQDRYALSKPHLPPC